jgi:hypothetical protein
VAGHNAGHIAVSLLVNNHLLIFAALCYLHVNWSSIHRNFLLLNFLGLVRLKKWRE